VEAPAAVLGASYVLEGATLGGRHIRALIAASPLGKLKTMVQVAMVFALIAVPGHPAWVQALIYLTVAVTLVSGADYLLGLRRRLEEASGRRAANTEAP